MTPGYWRESSYISGERWRPGITELAHGFLYIDSIPVNDGVEGKIQDAKLLLLALTQRASNFTPIAVMNATAELVPQFLSVELKQDLPAERSVVDVSQDVQRLDDAPQFRQGLGQGRWAVFDLKHSHDACGLEVAELERSSQTDQVGPVFFNQIDFDSSPGNLIELSVTHLAVNAPQLRAITSRKMSGIPAFGMRVWTAARSARRLSGSSSLSRGARCGIQ